MADDTEFASRFGDWVAVSELWEGKPGTPFLISATGTGSITRYYQVLPGITNSLLSGVRMNATLVTSKGQVTIPKEVRQHLGIRKGSRIDFVLAGDHVELRVQAAPTVGTSGFGMLKSRRPSVPVDLDPATLLKR